MLCQCVSVIKPGLRPDIYRVAAVVAVWQYNGKLLTTPDIHITHLVWRSGWTISHHTCHTDFITTSYYRVDWLTSLTSKLKYIALYCRAIYFATVDTDTCTVSTLLTALETFANFLFKVDFITLLSSKLKTFWITCNLLASLQIRKGTKIKILKSTL